MKNILNVLKLSAVAICASLAAASCSDYLDVVPDGVATIETAFSTRSNAEKFLFGCYSYLPNIHDVNYVGNVGSDEYYWDVDASHIYNTSGPHIFQGDQSSSNPYQNYWSMASGPWVGIRDCNIFLENIASVPDLDEWERVRWIAEVKFLKAYLHFFMMEMYGPIPIIDTNMDMETPTEEVRVFRDPVDDVTDYIVNLLDDCYNDLPDYIEDTNNEMGRITKSINRAVKAKVLVWAASPLMNGNTDYRGLVDSRGVQLVPQTYDQSKWIRARDAVKEAIDVAEQFGHTLYHYPGTYVAISDDTELNYTLRGCVTERESETTNMEPIWSCTKGNVTSFSRFLTPRFYTTYAQTSEYCAPLKIAEQYYTSAGVPMEEDKTYNYADRYLYTTNADSSMMNFIPIGETTANLNYYREPRFYAHLAFDRSLWQTTTLAESAFPLIRARAGEEHGYVYQDCHIPTGYFIKKLVSFRNSTTTTSPSIYRFNIPLIRLADLYLLYAETLNESQDAPDDLVYEYVDKIRERAGLEGVVDSWQKYSTNPSKPSTKEGMREIIKRERLIELAFEGQRFFDLRRWKDAMTEYNKDVQGWDYRSQTVEDYYNVTTYFSNRKYTVKDYLWPIRISDLDKNPNLVQNPGW